MKIVYSYYVLDILHRGHLIMMKNSKEIAGKEGRLIVGILTDKAVMEKKPKPVLSLSERMFIADSIKYVDLVVPQDEYSPIKNIKSIRPDILMESFSHSKDDIKKVKKTMECFGGTVIVLPYYPEQASTKIKESIKNGQ